MFDWIVEKKINTRTEIVNSLNELETNEITAAIVVNTASDHEKSTEWAILK
jgi:hypothetical protein